MAAIIAQKKLTREVRMKVVPHTQGKYLRHMTWKDVTSEKRGFQAREC